MVFLTNRRPFGMLLFYLQSTPNLVIVSLSQSVLPLLHLSRLAEFWNISNSRTLSTMYEWPAEFCTYRTASIYSHRHQSTRCHRLCTDGPTVSEIRPPFLPSPHLSGAFTDQEPTVTAQLTGCVSHQLLNVVNCTCQLAKDPQFISQLSILNFPFSNWQK